MISPGGVLSSASHTLTRWFPVPKLLVPPAAGIDISDASVKWLVLERPDQGLRVGSYGEVPLQAGVVVSGTVKNVDALAATLRQVRSHMGHVRAAHSALPEEAA